MTLNTLNPDFKVVSLFDTEYLKNSIRDRHILQWTYTYALLKGVISNDLEWLGEIFNDTKHRAASLRQQSFLSFNIVAKVGMSKT